MWRWDTMQFAFSNDVVNDYQTDNFEGEIDSIDPDYIPEDLEEDK